MVVAQNDGNVPVAIAHPRAVRMEPTNRQCVVIRSTLDKARGPVRIPVQDALVDAAAESVDADPILGARIAGAPMTLAPGHTVALKLRFRVPDLVEPEYSAHLRISGASLTVRVLNLGTSSDAETEPKRRPRQREAP